MQAAQSKPKQKRQAMTDDDIREHLEVTVFYNLYVSQQNIDDYRKAMKIPKK